MCPNWLTTTSNDPSLKGSASASPSVNPTATRDRRVLFRAIEESRGEIEALHFGACACRRDGDDTSTAAEVEHRLVGRNSSEAHELGSRDGGERLERQKERPALALHGLERSEWIRHGAERYQGTQQIVFGESNPASPATSPAMGAHVAIGGGFGT